MSKCIFVWNTGKWCLEEDYDDSVMSPLYNIHTVSDDADVDGMIATGEITTSYPDMLKIK